MLNACSLASQLLFSAAMFELSAAFASGSIVMNELRSETRGGLSRQIQPSVNYQ
jgi:hypothetical protein